MRPLHLLNVYYANCFKVKEPNASVLPFPFISAAFCAPTLSQLLNRSYLGCRIDFKCSHGLGEPQRPMLDAQAGRARPSPGASPPPSAPPPVPSPGMSPATLQHPLGTVGHIRQERGSPSGRVFSLSLPPWLPPPPHPPPPHPLAQGQPCSCWGLPPSHTGKGPRPSATEAPRPPGDPRRVLYCASHPVSGPWARPG